MRILILSFYYPPDLSAGSFRAAALVDSLEKRLGAGDRIDVLTTQPNRYHNFRTDAPDAEQQRRVHVRRFPVPTHRSGMLDQSRAYLSFMRNVRRAVRARNPDVVVATSSRLMTAFLGALVARRVGARLYLDIRDIFTETMEDVLRGRLLRFVLPPFYWIERFTLRSADRINVVSPGFVAYFRAIAPEKDFQVFTNGVDEVFLGHDFQSDRSDDGEGGEKLIVYAGNMGEGQGLHRIIPEVASRLGGHFRFRMIGDGGLRHELERAIADRGLANVELVNPVDRTSLLEHYREADAVFLHLNDYKAFHRVLPSKIFEYAATGKPILAGVAGVAARFLREEVPEAHVFAPCDVGGMVDACNDLTPGPVDRADFLAQYRRDAIMNRMAEDVLRLGDHR